MGERGDVERQCAASGTASATMQQEQIVNEAFEQGCRALNEAVSRYFGLLDEWYDSSGADCAERERERELVHSEVHAAHAMLAFLDVPAQNNCELALKLSEVRRYLDADMVARYPCLVPALLDSLSRDVRHSIES